ncbi:MAG: DUF86 domain-containing protein [Betaproteobacteria bacterium]|nr:DUF86 domain-containing protein [Betaproteobacteria bacterium]
MNAKSPRYRDYLEHMLDAIRQARGYVDGLTKEDFQADKKTQQAVILNIVIIGEAATQLIDENPDFANQHPGIPWKQMRGMRNRMAHGYFEIDLDIVWDTVQLSLPDLKRKLAAIVENLR